MERRHGQRVLCAPPPRRWRPSLGTKQPALDRFPLRQDGRPSPPAGAAPGGWLCTTIMMAAKSVNLSLVHEAYQLPVDAPASHTVRRAPVYRPLEAN